MKSRGRGVKIEGLRCLSKTFVQCPKGSASQCSGRKKMNIDQAKTPPHETVLLDEIEDIPVFGHGQRGQRVHER